MGQAMKKIVKFCSFSVAICLLVGSFMLATSARSLDPGHEGGGGGTIKSKVVYDYPPEWGEGYFIFESTVADFGSYIRATRQSYQSNLVVSVEYGIAGKTHLCYYSGMAPNWTQISRRTVRASY